ncbi:PAS domain S-box protein [Haloarcula marina]|uniref:PAS domain S-box protein n=1 Tax=Haloarcula marina TaxID=2961574 RepID=UPI0020B8CE26|nr:PAS domain S-box protein [Halomicroarcula marina]
MTERPSHDDRSAVHRDASRSQAPIDILYVDSDAATREAVAATMDESHPAAVVTTAESLDAAVEAVTADPPSCLVVDPVGVEASVRFLRETDVPVVLYTDRDPSELDDRILSAASTVVEKASDGGGLLAEKAVSAATSSADRREYTIDNALDTIDAEADTDLSVLVDGERVAWSSRPLETLLGSDATGETFYERLASVTKGGYGTDAPVASLRRDPSEPVTLSVTVDGDQRWLRCRGHDLPESAGSHRLFHLTDITERVHRESHRELLAVLTKHAQDGLYTLDKHGVIDFCNESFAEMLGYEPAELQGRHAAVTLAPGELERGQRTISELLAADSDETTVDLTFVHRDGTEFEVSIHYTLLRDDDGVYRGLMGVARDVTERKRREHELRRWKELFDGLVENFPNGGVFIFDEEMRYIAAGGEDLDDVGLGADDFVGRTPREVFPPENAELLEAAYASALNGESDAFEDEFLGREYHVQTMPIGSPDGHRMGMGVAQNISERVQRERDLEHSNTLLSTLFDALPVGILVEGPDREILTANERFVDLFGISASPSELEGTDCAESVERVSELFADPEAFRDGIERHLDERDPTVDESFELVDGRTVERSYLPMELPRGNGNLWLYRDVTDRTERQRELERTSERLSLALEGADVGIWDWDLESDVVTVDNRWAEMLGYDWDDHADILAEPTALIHPEDEADVEARLDLVLDGEAETYQSEHRILSASGEYRWVRGTGRVVSRDEDGEPLRAVGIDQDITYRKERQQQLEAQRDELARLTQTHRLIHDVIGALGSAATREEIQQTVCERLVASDLYELAWVGERDRPRNVLLPVVSAGRDDGYLDIVADRATEEDQTTDPGLTAIASGEAQVIDDITTDRRMAKWRTEALARNFRSAAVIPLRHDQVVHAALVVYANRRGAFTDRVVEAFTVLGEMVGFAFSAVQNRNLLTSDRFLEMEFQTESSDSVLLSVAAEHGCRFESAGSVNLGDETLQYLSVEGASPAAVLDSFHSRPAVIEGRVIRSSGETGVIEILLTEKYQSALLDAGARLRDFVVDDGHFTLTVEAPTDADPWTIQQTLLDHVPGLRLVSKQERQQRPTEPADSSSLRDRLTDRQLEVLQAAYLAGYYEWPRDTTAEQLADTLDIASPTLHQHLRRAERNLFDALLDL